MKSKREHNIVKVDFVIIKLFILFISFCTNTFSQDIHFTLFNNAPLFLNPANTGNFEGNWRITGNYRDQWRAVSEPFTTASVSFDKHFFLKNHKIDGGVYFIYDNSGAIGFTANKLFLSAAYEKPVNKNTFRVGLQAGYVFLAFGNESLTYPSDWDMGEGKFIGNNNPAEKKGYLDVNFGALWRTSFKVFESEAGISLSHINYPNESFFDAKERLPIRYNFHGKVKTNLSDNLYICPTIVYITRKTANAMVVGSNIGFGNFGRRSPVKEITTGIYFRDGLQSKPDAFSIVGGVSVGRIDLSICYDYNISAFKVATGNKGAIEISFAYRSISTVLNSYSIPCERF